MYKRIPKFMEGNCIYKMECEKVSETCHLDCDKYHKFDLREFIDFLHKNAQVKPLSLLEPRFCSNCNKQMSLEMHSLTEGTWKCKCGYTETFEKSSETIDYDEFKAKYFDEGYIAGMEFQEQKDAKEILEDLKNYWKEYYWIILETKEEVISKENYDELIEKYQKSLKKIK